MHGFLGLARYALGIIIYGLAGMFALIGIIGFIAVMQVIFGLKDEQLEMNVLAMRVGLACDASAFVLYWIARFLTKDTLGQIGERIKYFSR